jgi:hypothetical protein
MYIHGYNPLQSSDKAGLGKDLVTRIARDITVSYQDSDVREDRVHKLRQGKNLM